MNSDPEKQRANRRAQYLKHREKVLRDTRAYALAHPEQVKETARRWKLKHPEKRRASNQANVARMREEYRRLKENPCVDCGNRFPVEVMDFDHVRGEKKGVLSRMFRNSRSAFLEEVAKCDLICSNCHRIRTAARREAKALGPIQ